MILLILSGRVGLDCVFRLSSVIRKVCVWSFGADTQGGHVELNLQFSLSEIKILAVGKVL